MTESENYNYWFVMSLRKTVIRMTDITALTVISTRTRIISTQTQAKWAAIAKLLDNFSVKFMDTYREYAKSIGFTTDEIVIIASMIESEAKIPCRVSACVISVPQQA